MSTAIVAESVNEYGTPVSVLDCPDCGNTVTLCPVVPPERQGQWTGCMADDCPSYDVTRDADIWFDAAMEAGLVEREDPRP